MWKRFDPDSRRVITNALRDAASRGRAEAGPEHLLAAIARHAPQEGIDGRIIDQLDREQPRVAQPAVEYADRLSDTAVNALEKASRTFRRRLITPRQMLPPIVAALNGSLATPIVPPLASLTEKLSDFWPVYWLSKAIRLPRMGWNVYVRHSLGHPDYVNDPYRIFRKLRAREPVRRDPTAPVWVVTSYEHTLTTLKDPRFNKDPFISERLPRGARDQLGMSEGAGARSSVENISMLFLDPPQHTRVRSIFTRAFTPRTLEALRPRIAEVCNERIDMMGRKGEAELIEDLAYPLPVTVIAELLGFPREDYQKLKKWSDEMAEALGFVPSEDAKLRAARARDEMRVYFFEQIVPRLRGQRDNSLLSGLLDLEARGEGLSEDELFSNSVLLLAAGHETTTNLIGNGVLALLQYPKQLDLLRRDPALIESAVEELLRFDPPVQLITRVAAQDLELGGQSIRRGELVLAALGAANRDPAVFQNPEQLDIRRQDNRHLSFGSGIHFCLGAALARMEAQIAIGSLIARFPNLKLAGGKLKWRKGITFRGLHALPLKLS